MTAIVSGRGAPAAYLVERGVRGFATRISSRTTPVESRKLRTPLAPPPTQTAMVPDRSDRLLDEMVTQLGFNKEELERLGSAPPDLRAG
jgi:hypothetical protein